MLQYQYSVLFMLTVESKITTQGNKLRYLNDLTAICTKGIEHVALTGNILVHMQICTYHTRTKVYDSSEHIHVYLH